MSSVIGNLGDAFVRLLRGVVDALNPLRLFLEFLIGAAGVLVIIVAALMLPGILFGLLPEIMNAAFWWAKDAYQGVVDNILPLFLALLLGLAIVVDLLLDIGIFVINALGTAAWGPPIKNYWGQQIGGWYAWAYNPLSALVTQIYNFFNAVYSASGGTPIPGT